MEPSNMGKELKMTYWSFHSQTGACPPAPVRRWVTASPYTQCSGSNCAGWWWWCLQKLVPTQTPLEFHCMFKHLRMVPSDRAVYFLYHLFLCSRLCNVEDLVMPWVSFCMFPAYGQSAGGGVAHPQFTNSTQCL